MTYVAFAIPWHQNQLYKEKIVSKETISNLAERFVRWARIETTIFFVSLSPEARTALDKLKQQPDDSIETVLREALLTHEVVLGEIRSGGRIHTNRDGLLTRLPFEHLDTDLPPSSPPKRPSPFRVIKGSKR